MKGPRCQKHQKRHYMVNDCDQCKQERITSLELRLAKAEELTVKLRDRVTEAEMLNYEIKIENNNLKFGLNQERGKPRCEHCGSDHMILMGCPRCGAPQCCDQCCQITTLTDRVERLQSDLTRQESHEKG